jgi:hypothetical protein
VLRQSALGLCVLWNSIPKWRSIKDKLFMVIHMFINTSKITKILKDSSLILLSPSTPLIHFTTKHFSWVGEGCRETVNMVKVCYMYV